MKDFEILEALLSLFARIVPSDHSKSKKSAFLRDVFISKGAEREGCGQTIVKLLEADNTKVWDETSVEIVDILAASNSNLYVDGVFICMQRCLH